MLCRIADLTVEVPASAGLLPRCEPYGCAEDVRADIVIDSQRYDLTQWPGASEETAIYLESGFQFYGNLLRFDGLMLHSSAIEMEGRAYLFSGPCGAGKSTHTHLWQAAFGASAQVFNDDKPALRRIGGIWYAYGTPWCGKDGINQNKKVPLAGVCFLKQAKENRIRRLTPDEAALGVISQTMYKFKNAENLSRMLSLVDMLVREIPVFELQNRPEQEAALLSFETMRRAALEAGL